jgi:RHS repeat-associated protein
MGGDRSDARARAAPADRGARGFRRGLSGVRLDAIGYDDVGNITALLDNHDTVAATSATYRYDPYGRLLASDGGMAAANVCRFSSKEVHPNSGLYYYGFRFYDPTLQRWLNRDPIFERGGVNLYMFVRNAPVFLMDYFGLKDWTCEETEGLLAEMRTQSPFEAFLNHNGRGKYDFKSKDDKDTFVVDGRTMPADAFGNYAAGYGGQHTAGSLGYLGVRAGGVFYDFFDAGRFSRVNNAKPASFDFDADSVADINAGRDRPVEEQKRLLPQPDMALMMMHSPRNHVCNVNP